MPFVPIRASEALAYIRRVKATGLAASRASRPARICMREVRESNVDIGGRRYVMASDDSYLEKLRGTFEPDMVGLFRAVASGSRTILDIGANIGCTAILFGGIADAVHAFEPSPTTFGFLRRNVERAGVANVSLHNVGLGETPGRFTLTFAPSNRAGGFVSDQTQASSGHAVEDIEIRRLDDVMPSLDAPPVDFIKIDVEGFEAHVLRGASATLAASRPLLVLELNHWCLNAFQRTSIPDYFDLLRSLFPVLVAVDGASYLDLHNESERYIVMYHHIVHMRFPNLLAAYDEGRLQRFRASYRNHFVA
jgi:FkbM family methyltransferase